MTAINVAGGNCVEAWRRGVEVVLARREVFNLFTTVERPTELEEEWFTRFSPHSRGKYDKLGDVAGTIFPSRLSGRVAARQDIYARYLQAHDRGKRLPRNRSSWGTYFERLVRFPPTGTNQLERVIEKLRTWNRTTTAFVFHLSSSTVDAPRRLGGPCWQYGELLWRQTDVIDFSVTYRNHDFFNKALGNFVGLGQLLSFICRESGKQPGRLFCHSVHAYSSKSQVQLRALADL